MLKLRLVASQDGQEGREIALDRQTLLIGRDPPEEPGALALTLPDPDRIISRLHARLEYRDGCYHLHDTSVNGVFVNDAPVPVGRGNEVVLHDGDVLTIGGHRLQVEIAAEPVDGVERTAVDTAAPEPFPAWEEAGPSQPVAAEEPPFDFPDDLFAGLDKVGGATEPEPPAPPPEPEVPSPLAEPFSPPPSAAPEPPRGDEPAARPEPGEERAGAALSAFLEGAGLSGRLQPEELPGDVHRLVGALLRILVQGLMDLLRSRAQIKNELRLEMTVLGALENNPLKFSVTVEDALRHLLKPESGYLEGEAAVQEAVDDLIAHQVAVVAGMQSAFRALLQRFDPQELERQTEKLYPMLSHAPALGEARCWRLFKQRHEALTRDLDENFVALFGQLFADAYEEQARRLQRRGGRS